MNYSWAVQVIQNWLNMLSICAFPGQFTKSFGLMNDIYFNEFNIEDLKSEDILSRISKPFRNYYMDILIPKIKKEKYKVVGINITYVFQLTFALYLGKLIKQYNKDIKIIFGGTETSDVWKYLNNREKFFSIFDMADVCIVGEGESSFVEVLDSIKNKVKLYSHDNILVNSDWDYNKVNYIKAKYEDIHNLPVPSYEKIEANQYLSPYSFVYYSPSRGCYWNKCVFCDYGLNSNSPTSPWRHYSVEKIVSDLREISKNYKFVYLSVDVLSPDILLKLAKRIVEEKIDIRWGAEVRLEKNWTIDRCQLLKDSGCLAISVGFESGNQRILDLINKGTKVDRIKETMKNFSKVGIAVEVMGFTGFPSESFDEAMETINYLKKNKDKWTFAGIGEFVLTGNSIISKNPKEFNIKKIKSYDNDDIQWRRYYEEESINIHEKEYEMIKKAKGTLGIKSFDRPWVGGIDTAHTFFYLDKYGIKIKECISMLEYYENFKKNNWKLNGIIKQDIEGYPVRELVNKNILKKFDNDNLKVGIAINSKIIRNYLEKCILEYKQDIEKKYYFIRTDGEIYELSEVILKFLDQFKKAKSLEEVINYYEDINSYSKIAKYCVSNLFLCLE